MALPSFSRDKSYGLAFIEFEKQFDMFAVNLTKSQTPDRKGLLWSTYSPEAYEEKFDAEPEGPLEDVGPYAGDAAAIANQRIAHENKRAEELGLAKLMQVFLEVVPNDLLHGMYEDGTLLGQSLQDLMDKLRAMCKLKPPDFKILRSNISRPYSMESKSIRSFTNSVMEALALLQEHNQTIPDLQAMELIISAFESTKEIVDNFSACWTEFYASHGDTDDQTPEQLCAFINLFVEQRLHHHQRANSARRIAQASVANAVYAQAIANQTAADADFDKRVAAAAVALTQKANQKLNQKSKHTKKTVSHDPPYCWSCGPLKVQHTSGCWHKKPGHRDDATFHNRLGGTN